MATKRPAGVQLKTPPNPRTSWLKRTYRPPGLKLRSSAHNELNAEDQYLVELRRDKGLKWRDVQNQFQAKFGSSIGKSGLRHRYGKIVKSGKGASR